MKLDVLHIMKNRHNKWVFNSLLWLFFFSILLLVFADFPLKKIDLIYTVSYVLSLVFPVTITLYYLIPSFLKKEKYVLFTLLLIVTILVFAYLNITFHQRLIDLLFPNYFFISYYNSSQTLLLFTLLILTALFIKLAEDWVYFNQKEKLQIQTKLNALKGQINPHFLFNSLNVLYALSLEKKEETTNAIIQLSDILRYVIYDVETDTIPIQKEIALIENYIAFEKNRHVENSKVSFNHSVKNNVEIYPMLLLPIIENAFKHGLKSGVKNPFVIINLQANNNELNFEVKNNYIAITKEKTNTYYGVGLKNVEQNLNIIYPNKHKFTVENLDNLFTVQLQIKL